MAAPRVRSEGNKTGMKVTVKSFANIRDVVGTGELAVDVTPGTSLGGLFEVLGKRYGAAFDRQIRDQITGAIVPFLVLINDQTYRTTTDLDVVLNDGDTITIMIPFDGG